MTAPIFANSAFVRAPERLMLKGGSWRQTALCVRYGLFLGRASGPVLIDTGYTSHAVTAPNRSFALRFYGRVLRPALLAEGQPDAFLSRHGLTPQDIRTVVVTHFHADHVSGLGHFPNARFLTSTAAWTIFRQRGTYGNLRHGVFPELVPPDFQARLDLIETRPTVQAPLLPSLPGHDLFGDGTMIAVPLPGHASGHVGVIFPGTPRPLLYAVDAQWLCAALPANRRPGYPAALIAEDKVALARSSTIVAAFAQAGGDVVLCHDPEPTPYDDPARG
jgi:glyoxylase-like metal-dependent hydrolase (beta-lactamase superfamily II)